MEFKFNFEATNIDGLLGLPDAKGIAKHLAIITHEIVNNVDEYSYIDDRLEEGLHIGRVFQRCIRDLKNEIEILATISMIDDIMIEIMKKSQLLKELKKLKDGI